jgi:hypothetical protein
MGLSTAFVTVAPTAITGVAASPLTSIVACSGTDYVAGSGKLWPISSSAVGALPVSTLATTLCAAITKNVAALNPVLIRSATTGTIYNLVAGKKIAQTFASLALLPGTMPLVYANVNDAYLASVANG